MDTATRAWLLAELGAATDQADLEDRYTRLASARAVAIEVLKGRLAALAYADQPGTVNVSSVVAANYTENIKALERKIAQLESGYPPAPDETLPGDEDGTGGQFGIIQLTTGPRR